MKYTLTIERYDYNGRVLMKNSMEQEFNLRFENYSDAKEYAIDQAYNYLEIEDRSLVKIDLSVDNGKLFVVRLERCISFKRFECSAYLRRKE